MTPEECLVQYGVAWFTRDRAERIEVLRACCTEDGRMKLITVWPGNRHFPVPTVDQ